MIAFAAAQASSGFSEGGRARSAVRRRRPTDRELQAYVDGALDTGRAAEVEAVLRRDAGLRRTVHLYRMLNHVARLLYEDTLREPIPERLQQLLSRRPSRG